MPVAKILLRLNRSEHRNRQNDRAQQRTETRYEIKFSQFEKENLVLQNKFKNVENLNSLLNEENSVLKEQIALMKEEIGLLRQESSNLKKENLKVGQLFQKVKVQKVKIAELNTEKEKLKKNVLMRDLISFQVFVQLLTMMVQTGNFDKSNCTKDFLERHVPTNLKSSGKSIRINSMNHPVIRAFRHICKNSNKYNFNTRLAELFESGHFGPKKARTNSMTLGRSVADFSAKAKNSIEFKIRKLHNTDLHKNFNGENCHFGPR